MNVEAILCFAFRGDLSLFSKTNSNNNNQQQLPFVFTGNFIGLLALPIKTLSWSWLTYR